MKKILVTGGSGFLGRHLALAIRDQYDVCLAGRNNLANQQAQALTGCTVRSMDVSNIESVRDVFNEFHPDIVIHAAATKYVDWSERQPLECIDVNVVGSQNVARVSIEHGVELVVGISTDKATPPARNIYGLSKSMMERMFCALDLKNGTTKFVCTRFGNIAWSSGSIFPLWQQMYDASDTPVIKSTGPENRRFFFTVDEAVKLVMNAVEYSDKLHGKVLTKRMKSAQIKDILDAWVSINGGRWTQVSARPGDAVDEFLVGLSELPYTNVVSFDDKEQYYVISMSEKSPNLILVAPSSENAQRMTHEEIVDMLESSRKWT